MIDIENSQFTKVKVALGTLCKGYGTSTVSAVPAAWPYMSFVQMDNPTYQRTIDSGSSENHVQPMIQISVYSNSNKTECKTVMAAADAVMIDDGWTRIFGPQPIETNSSYFRMDARYQAVVDKNKNIFRI